MSRAIAVVMLLGWLAEASLAQRTRFPGDSPTRQSLLGSKTLGTPSGKRPTTRHYTVPMQDYYRYNPGGLGCDYGYGYNRPYGPTYYPGYYNRYAPVMVIDWRTLYGFQPPQPPRPAAPAVNRMAMLPRPAPPIDDGPSPTELKRAWRYVDLGDWRLRQGELVEARARYRKARKIAPDLAELPIRMALLELATGRFEEASEALAEGLSRHPGWPEERFDLSLVYSGAVRKQVDLIVGERLARFPNDADARLMAGVLLHLDGRRAAARVEFERALKVTRGDSVAAMFLPAEDAKPRR